MSRTCTHTNSTAVSESRREWRWRRVGRVERYFEVNVGISKSKSRKKRSYQNVYQRWSAAEYMERGEVVCLCSPLFVRLFVCACALEWNCYAASSWNSDRAPSHSSSIALVTRNTTAYLQLHCKQLSAATMLFNTLIHKQKHIFIPWTEYNKFARKFVTPGRQRRRPYKVHTHI